MSEGNGQLPAGWRAVTLGDVCVEDRRIVEGRSERAKELRYLSLEHIESKTGRVLREPSEPLEDEGCSTTFAFDERHVLYGKLRPYLNKVALPDFSGRCTTELIPLLPTGDLVREYLAFLLRRDDTVEIAMRGKTGSRMPRADMNALLKMEILLPPLEEQRRIATRLREQLSILAEARTALDAQLAAAAALVSAYVREDARDPAAKLLPIRDVFAEVAGGVGENWRGQPVLGATRDGLAPSKEGVGKHPHRYKPVTPGTIFYNPMRILLGSIALVDNDDTPGITSPDYVVMRGREGVLHSVWFYHWFRSLAGAEFIKSLTRGAVRERLLFNRLAQGQVVVPPWPRQLETVERIRAATALRTAIEAKIAELSKLPAALLRAAFQSSD